MGAGEKDFSMLFTYASCDNYLKEGGKLAFLITHEVFKSKGAGEGFRQFELKEKKIPLRVILMEDMVDLKPFQAANKTSLFVLEKGKGHFLSRPSCHLEEASRNWGIPRIGHCLKCYLTQSETM